MRKLLLLFSFMAAGVIALNAQVTEEYLITFEAESDTTGWLVFGNGANATDEDVTVVENPDATGINPTEMALRFVVRDDADPWAGMVLNDSLTGDNAIVITEENHIFTMMVYKSNLERVGLKLERGLNGAPNVEVVVPNTVTDEWELLTFDFSEYIGSTYEALVIFPDFPLEMRTQGAEVYIDNIAFGEGSAVSADILERMSLRVYPNPAQHTLHIQQARMTGYVISNSLGQRLVMKNFDAADHVTVELGSLKPGLHFISVQSDEGMHTARFIKK